MKTKKWIPTVFALAGLMVGPVSAQEELRSSAEIAMELEATAATLHDHADRWQEVAVLYEVAAELRPGGDAQAQRDLFVAANLHLETGRVGRAIAALETAATRALQSGDAELAHERFADAALVAQRAGLSREHQRLSYRIAEVASALGLQAARTRRDVVGAVPFRW